MHIYSLNSHKCEAISSSEQQPLQVIADDTIYASVEVSIIPAIKSTGIDSIILA